MRRYLSHFDEYQRTAAGHFLWQNWSNLLFVTFFQMKPSNEPFVKMEFVFEIDFVHFDNCRIQLIFNHQENVM